MVNPGADEEVDKSCVASNVLKRRATNTSKVCGLKTFV
jgi:hypothetical protein